MKVKNLCLLMSVALLSIACDKGFILAYERPEESVTIDVTVPVSIAKAASDANEDAVANIKVYVFRAGGVLESIGSSEGNSVQVSCTTGDKTIAVVVNAPDIAGVTSFSELQSSVSDLSDNGLEHFVMYGEKAEKITASTPVTVEVSRLVAKVSILKIVNDFQIEQYRQADFRINGIYLVNAAGSRKYGINPDGLPVQWYNGNTASAPVKSLLASDGLNALLKADNPYSVPHCFYCYPNVSATDSSESTATEKYTRLVVETSMNGKTYYYPVSIPNIKSNCRYVIKELRITKLGSDSPNIPVTSLDASFQIDIQPWVKGSELSPVI